MKGFTRIMALAGGTALASLACPAFAQDAGGQAVGAPTVTGEAATDAQGSAEGDIIVTANKREERLQDVPISVSVINGEQLTKQNIVEVTDLVRSTPALNSAGPFGALSIRGVGSLSFSRSSEGSVGVVVDGVALANTSTTPPQLFDVARVKVLEGLQGNVVGRTRRRSGQRCTTVGANPDKWGSDRACPYRDARKLSARGTIDSSRRQQRRAARLWRVQPAATGASTRSTTPIFRRRAKATRTLPVGAGFRADDEPDRDHASSTSRAARRGRCTNPARPAC